MDPKGLYISHAQVRCNNSTLGLNIFRNAMQLRVLERSIKIRATL
jgi:hypothetical protein